MFWLGIEWLFVFRKTAFALAKVDKMFSTEIKSAAVFTTVWLSAANVCKSSVYHLIAIRMVAPRRHAVSDVALPSVIVSDFPTHINSLRGFHPSCSLS